MIAWRVMILIFLMLCLSCANGETSDSGESANEDQLDLHSREGRLSALVSANIKATHAYQVRLAQAGGMAERSCYDAAGLSREELDAVVARQEVLVRADPGAVLSWVDGDPSEFNPAENLLRIVEVPLELKPALPVNVYTDYLRTKVDAPEYQLRSVANLYQTCLEVERDGTLLWDLYHFYIALGLPVYVGQFGLPGSDEDFHEVGKVLEKSCCLSPFETDAAAWRIAGRKVWNWGEKKLHVRDRFTIAKEILSEPEVRRLLVQIKSVSPCRVAIVGHSFTMDSHWSSPSSFAAIVDAIFQMENPAVCTRQWFGGGLTASRVRRSFYEDVLAWKPDRVLFVVAIRNDDDVVALKEMAVGLRAAGAEIYAFDNVADPSEDQSLNVFSPQRQSEFDLTVIEVGELLAASPNKDGFLCLDGIHMKEAYHRLMAKEWLRLLIGARSAALGGP